MSVLDLPLAKQEEIAALEGMPHNEWVAVTERELKENKAFLKDIESKPSNLNTEEQRRLYEKMASGNSPV